ncbi:MAG: hypothetical protein IPN90_13615, partial [Elusimicrobia bacterium]|nr:hypothetical protein [Elusimicrobiota bacterium]
ATGNELVAGIMDGLWPRAQIGSFLRDTVSPLPHFELFTRGVIDLHAAIYFALMIVFPLWMTHLVLERDRY